MAIITEYRSGSTIIQIDNVNSEGLTPEQKQKNWTEFCTIAQKLLEESFADCTQDEADRRIQLGKQKADKTRERIRQMKIVFDNRNLVKNHCCQLKPKNTVIKISKKT